MEKIKYESYTINIRKLKSVMRPQYFYKFNSYIKYSDQNQDYPKIVMLARWLNEHIGVCEKYRKSKKVTQNENKNNKEKLED